MPAHQAALSYIQTLSALQHLTDLVRHKTPPGLPTISVSSHTESFAPSAPRHDSMCPILNRLRRGRTNAGTGSPDNEKGLQTKKLRKGTCFFSKVRSRNDLINLLSAADEGESSFALEAVAAWINAKRKRGQTDSIIIAKVEDVEMHVRLLPKVNPT
ncbi:hypothetical protein CALVIDRAFT_533321, partial [Calocera viscosa TUFC12733]